MGTIVALVIGMAFAGFIWNDLAKRGHERRGWWALGAFFFGWVVLPIHFARRKLLEGETRFGGFGWNVCRNLAVMWTLFVLAVGLLSCADMAMDEETLALEASGLATMGLLGTLGCMWVVPLGGLLMLGVFLKTDEVEEGPSEDVEK